MIVRKLELGAHLVTRGVVVLLLGCSSGDAPSSSSEQWATCRNADDCKGLTGDAECSQGYCVSAGGERLPGVGSPDGACDPFATAAASRPLGELVGAGRADDGTVYVVDSVEGEYRVFVGAEETLVRVDVLGAGSGSDAEGTRTSISFVDPDGASRTLLVWDDGTTIRMWLVEGSREEFTPPEGSAELGAVAETDLAHLSLTDAPSIEIEYLVLLQDGRPLVVLRPAVDWSYEDFRVFVGDDPAKERRVINVSRARDGGSTHVVFDLDGQSADAFFPFDGSPTITVGGEETALRFVDAPLPTLDTFVCLLGPE